MPLRTAGLPHRHERRAQTAAGGSLKCRWPKAIRVAPAPESPATVAGGAGVTSVTGEC